MRISKLECVPVTVNSEGITAIHLKATLDNGMTYTEPVVWSTRDFENNSPEQACKLVQSLFINAIESLCDLIEWKTTGKLEG